MDIRPQVQKLMEPLGGESAASDSEEMISVSSATKRIAFVYERFRNTLEPDEEDILRRKAIYRILERRLREDRPPLVVAEALLQELIRGNYIEPVSKDFADRVGQLLWRAQQIRQELTTEIREWFLHIVAVAIDRELYPREQEESLVQLMYEDTYRRTAWADDFVTEKERPVQLYIGCHRALFKADDYEIAFHYFQHHFPVWKNERASVEEMQSLLGELPEFYAQVQSYILHPARGRIMRLLRPVSVPYRILRHIISEGQGGKLESGEEWERVTREAVKERSQRMRGSMDRRAWHSILFLFFTKTIVAGIIEVPYEVFLLKKLHWLALGVNIVFHPLLLMVLATTVRLPGTSNTDKIVELVQRIVTDDTLPTVVVRKARSYGTVMWSLFGMVYAVLFLGIFWGLFYVLDWLQFSLVAMFMFVIFLGLVSFLAARIRRTTADLRVIIRREGALSSVLSFLSLPVLEFGRWLAEHISQINVALFFMDKVLEAPFKVLIDVVEEWFTFVRDRREEII